MLTELRDALGDTGEEIDAIMRDLDRFAERAEEEDNVIVQVLALGFEGLIRTQREQSQMQEIALREELVATRDMLGTGDIGSVLLAELKAVVEGLPA
jgi:hypothetical protein